jgi:hypothetical protein
LPILLCLVNLGAAAHGQQHEPGEAAGGPFTDTAVLDAPFSADAITTVRESLPNGSVQEHTLTAGTVHYLVAIFLPHP